MNLKEMAEQYRENAAAYRKRISELKTRLESENNAMEALRLRGRIRTLESFYAESMNTAHYLDRYYAEQHRGENDVE